MSDKRKGPFHPPGRGGGPHRGPSGGGPPRGGGQQRGGPGGSQRGGGPPRGGPGGGYQRGGGHTRVGGQKPVIQLAVMPNKRNGATPKPYIQRTDKGIRFVAAKLNKCK